MPICSLCSCEKTQSWIIRHENKFITVEELENSIQEGCRACLMLRDGIESFEKVRLFETTIRSIRIITRQCDQSLVSDFLQSLKVFCLS